MWRPTPTLLGVLAINGVVLIFAGQAPLRLAPLSMLTLAPSVVGVALLSVLFGIVGRRRHGPVATELASGFALAPTREDGCFAAAQHDRSDVLVSEAKDPFVGGHRGHDSFGRGLRMTVFGRASRRGRILAVVLVAGCVVLMSGIASKPRDAMYWDVVLLWMGLLALFMVAVGVPGRWMASLPAILSTAWRNGEVRVLAALLVMAALLRGVGLELAPRHFHGDEGVFAFAARDALAGAATNPFATGWTSNPTLVYFLQGAMMRIFGETVPGVRALSVVGGVLGILVTYLWLRSMFGRPTALLGGLLLTGYDAHLYFSRVALRHSWDSVWLPLTLWLFYLGVTKKKPWCLALAGVSAGLAQYWYFGTRILPVLLGVLFAYFAVFHRDLIRPLARSVGLVVAGFVLAFLPLGVHYAGSPSTLTERVQMVTSGSFYSIPATASRTGEPEPVLYWENAVLTLLAYHREAPKIPFFTTGRPLLDPVSAGLVLVGMAAAVVGWRDPRYATPLISLMLVLAVVSVTEHAPQAQRLFTAVAPLIVLITIGLVDGLHLVLRPFGASVAVVLRTGLVFAVALALSGAWLLFGEYLPSGRDMSGNTEVATELAYYLREQPGPVTYYLFAQPRMSTETHPSLPFIARNARGIDVVAPAAAASAFGLGPGRTLFVFLPHRLAEVAMVQEAWPGPAPEPHLNRQGLPVFYVFKPNASP